MTEEAEIKEPFVVKFEKALEKRHLFLLPSIIMVIGFAFLVGISYLSLADIANNHPEFDPFALLGYPLEIDYWTISVLFLILIPVVMLGVYFICLIPITLLALLGGRGMAVTGLRMDIAKIGEKHGGIQLVQRSLLPGLFGIGIGQGAISLVFAPFNLLQPWPLSFTVFSVVVYSLLGLILGIVLFPTTWFTDDAGIVIHGMLETPYRIPPRVVGVGTWIRSFFAGLTLFLYPLTMTWTFFVGPYLATGPLPLMDIFLAAFIIIIVLPVAMISINIPFVLLTERWQPKMIKRVQSFAQKLRARHIDLQDAKVLDVTLGNESESS
ncbi:MAG: hypothetical protein ACTSU3_08625 [Candidatus Thorarchaeota archaeon]